MHEYNDFKVHQKLDVCCQQIPEKTIKKQQDRTIMSKIKIVPPFWIISHCYAKSREVGDRQWQES
jgi:hypothetical protein